MWTLGAFIALLAIATTLFDWRIALWLMAAALPFEDALAFNAAASSIRLISALCIWALALRMLTDGSLTKRLPKVLRSRPVSLMALLVAWSFCSILWATSTTAALVKSSTFMGLLLLMIAVAMLEMREQVKLWTVLSISASASVLAGPFIMPATSTIAQSGRFTSGGQNPDDYAALLLIIALVGFIGLREVLPTWLRYSLLALMMGGVTLTGTRTALVALVGIPIGLIIAPGSWARRFSIVKLLPALCVLALGLGALISLNPGQVELATSRYETLRDYQRADTWAGRLNRYRAAIHIMEQRPLLGVGSGNFVIIAPSISSGATRTVETHFGSGALPQDPQFKLHWDAHNMFLSVGSELGLVGLVLFLAVVLSSFRILRRNIEGGPLIMGLTVGLCIFVVTGLALTWEPAKIPYIMIGSILSLALEPSRQKQSLGSLDDS